LNRFTSGTRAPLLAAALLLVSGCAVARPREAGRVAPGMSRDAVLEAIGGPDEALPIPGPPRPASPARLWRYNTEHPFDVIFGGDGNVLRVSPVPDHPPER
jgi:hypothetical protein